MAHVSEPSSGTAPPTLRPRDRLLLEYLREHDAACPVCGYNVRALSRPVCPECQHELVLTVGAAQPRMAWLFIALAPGFFSGIAACFTTIPTVAVTIEDDRIPWPLVGLTLFGFSSGLFAILLAFAKRRRFMAMPQRTQTTIALTIWGVHIGALVLFILIMMWLV